MRSCILREVPVVVICMSVNDSDMSTGNTGDRHIPSVTNTAVNVSGVETLETLVETDVSLINNSYD